MTGYILKLAGAAIHWKSRKQSLITLSTAEAKYITLSDATRDVVWLRRAAVELGIIHVNGLIPTYTNSASVLQLTATIPSMFASTIGIKASTTAPLSSPKYQA